MNEKAQIFSLDFILAFILIVLAIGLTINYFETITINAKENANKQELWLASKTAFDIITNSTQTTCRLISADSPPAELDYLPNCIPKRQITIAKQELGIPQTAFCFAEETTIPKITQFEPLITECNDSPPEPLPNIFSVERTVLILDKESGEQEITKAELLDCQKDDTLLLQPCLLKEGKIRIKVWK